MTIQDQRDDTGDHNIITLDTASPPLFTQRVVLVDPAVRETIATQQPARD